MINASRDSTSCWMDTTCTRVGIVLTTVLIATAVALIVLGNLKMNILLLPGYVVAGGAGLVGLLTLIQYIGNLCVYSSFKTPVTPKQDISAKSEAPVPPDHSGFREIVALPGTVHLGSFKVGEVLPFHHIKLNPYDLDRLGIEDGSRILLGNHNVYTALAAPEIDEGCIGMSLCNKLELNTFKPISHEILARGIITPFSRAAPIADRLTLESEIGSKEVLFYNPTYLQKQLIKKLQGHILTHHQQLDTINVEGCDLRFGVRGINPGEYRTVGAATTINLINAGIPLNENVSIEEATFTFALVYAVQLKGNEGLQLFPKTDGELSESDIRFFESFGIDPSIPAEEPNPIPRKLPDLNTLKPHILKQVQKLKSGIWSLPKTVGLISTNAFWKVGEEFYFDAQDIRYTVRLSAIQAKGRTVSCATVGIRSETPKGLIISPIPIT